MPEGSQVEFITNLVGNSPSKNTRIPEHVFKELEILKTTLDVASIVAFTDGRGSIQHVNDNFCKISGYSRNELLGRDHRLINSSHHSKDFFKDMWNTISSGKVWRGEIKNLSKEGNFYWVDTTIVPFFYEGSRPSRYVAIRNDITERKNIQQELEDQRVRMIFAEKMASLGELTAGISHELATPIAAIQGRAELLGHFAEHDQSAILEHVRKTVGSILTMTDRMQCILRSMRSLARNGGADPFFPIPIFQLIKNTVDFGAEKFRRRGISIEVRPFDESVMVSCRESEIMQILINLLNNACDAIQDLDERWIQVEAREDGEGVKILVTDSGRGLSEDLRQKLFTPFFTTKDVGKGTGLGLNISRKLARQHGGDLGVDELCPNTCFVLRIPKTQSTQA